MSDELYFLKSLMGPARAKVRENRQICLDNMGLTNDFDAFLSDGKRIFSTFLKCAAVSLRQKLWGNAEHFCTLVLKMEDIISPRTKAKALYRRAVANRLLHHEGQHLRTALNDIKLVHELHPENVELKRLIHQQRDACGPFNPGYVQTNEDSMEMAKEQRIKFTRKYLESSLSKRQALLYSSENQMVYHNNHSWGV
ncbi:hypothetical protein C8R44DRAFT_878165 [Mycena epipterygia]|nr:hypothetical protein C8R44DRAFT_878165 [Mycena epipterygia]